MIKANVQRIEGNQSDQDCYKNNIQQVYNVLASYTIFIFNNV